MEIKGTIKDTSVNLFDEGILLKKGDFSRFLSASELRKLVKSGKAPRNRDIPTVLLAGVAEQDPRLLTEILREKEVPKAILPEEVLESLEKGRRRAKVRSEKAVEEWIEHLESRMKRRTVNAYRRIIKKLEKWLDEKTLLEVEYSDLERFIDHLADKGYRKKTLGRQISGLKSFYRFLQKRYDITDPKPDLLSLQDYRNQPGPMEKKDVEKGKIRAMMGAAERWRDLLFLLIPCYTGLRKREVARLKLDDINWEERTITVREETAKGGESREVRYHRNLDYPLKMYLQEERKGYPWADDSDYLFGTREKSPPHDDYLRIVVHRLAEEAGVQEKVGKDAVGKPKWKIDYHALRHTYVTNALEDMDPEDVKESCGHTYMRTTEGYDHRDEKEFLESYDEFKGY